MAVIGVVTGGATFGAGAEEVRHMLAGESDVSRLYFLLKFVATWITSWSGVPGGIFAPSLSIGAGVGHDVAQISAGTNSALAPSLIALGMAAYLAAATQAPLTSFIIVMEMINGRSMVLSLMAAAMLASLIARLISRPLYHTLSSLMIECGGESACAARACRARAPPRRPKPKTTACRCRQCGKQRVKLTAPAGDAGRHAGRCRRPRRRQWHPSREAPPQGRPV